MTFPSLGGGYQIGDGNLNEIKLFTQPVPATATATATLTVAQLMTGIVLGSPGSSAAAYTLPTVALLEATVINPKVGTAFDFAVVNVNGSASGVITMTAGTGWTLVGLATIAATAGTAAYYRAVKTGVGTWTLYTIS